MNTNNPLRLIQMMKKNDDEVQPRVVYTLVHGTFARKATWSSPNSLLRKSIETTFTRVVVFTWSGRNRSKDRVKGSINLRLHLYRLVTKYPNSKIVVIGHSHGGNVIMYALKDDVLRSKIDGVITLATPYIVSNRRDLEAMINALFITLPAGLVVPAVLYLLGSDVLFDYNIHMVWAVLALVSALFFLFLSDRETIKAEIKSYREKVLVSIAKAQEYVSHLLNVESFSDVPILSIAPWKDEAFGALRIIDKVGEQPVRIINRSRDGMRVLGKLVLGGVLIISVSRAVFRMSGEAGIELLLALLIILLIIGILPAFFFWLHAAVLLIPIIRRLPYGDYNFIDSILCRLFVVNELPRADDNVENIEIRSLRSKGLRHSVYDDPDAVFNMIRWIKNEVAKL